MFCKTCACARPHLVYVQHVQQKSESPSSRSGYSGQTVKGQTASLLSPGRAANLCAGMSHAYLLSHTSIELLLRQVQQQRWQPPARKRSIVDLSARYFFEPIAVETLGVFNESARVLLDNLGRRITSSYRETSFLYQRVSVLIQRYNVVLLHDSLPSTDRTDR